MTFLPQLIDRSPAQRAARQQAGLGRRIAAIERTAGSIGIGPNFASSTDYPRWEVDENSLTFLDAEGNTDVTLEPERGLTYEAVYDEPTAEPPASYLARDTFDQSAGNLNGKTATEGGAWVTAGGDADDFTIDTVNDAAVRSTVSDTGTALAGRFAVLGPESDSQIVHADFTYQEWNFGYFGLLLRYKNTTNWVSALASSGTLANGVRFALIAVVDDAVTDQHGGSEVTSALGKAIVDPLTTHHLKAVSRRNGQVDMEISNAIYYKFASSFAGTTGALTGKTLDEGGVEWAGVTWAGAGDADDLSVVNASGVYTANRTAVSDANADTGRYMTVTGAIDPIDSVGVSVEMSASATSGVVGGPVARYTDQNNLLRVEADVGAGTLRLVKRVASTNTTLATASLGTFSLDTMYRLDLVVLPDGSYTVTKRRASNGADLVTLTGTDSALATAGALASGRAGFHDTKTTATASTRKYRNFFCWDGNRYTLTQAGHTPDTEPGRLLASGKAGIFDGAVGTSGGVRSYDNFTAALASTNAEAGRELSWERNGETLAAISNWARTDTGTGNASVLYAESFAAPGTPVTRGSSVRVGARRRNSLDESVLTAQIIIDAEEYGDGSKILTYTSDGVDGYQNVLQDDSGKSDFVIRQHIHSCTLFEDINPQSFATGITEKVEFSSGTTDFGEPGLAPQADLAGDRVYIRKSGIYMIVGKIAWASNATGSRQAKVLINGVAEEYDIRPSPGSASQQVVYMRHLEDEDYVELEGVQTSGGNLSTQSLGHYGFASLSVVEVGGTFPA